MIFPEFTPEKIYMESFTDLNEVPSRWSTTVEAMLDDVEFTEAFLMVDAAVVEGGKLHRRGGVHVDNNWVTGIQAHSTDRHYPPQPSHLPPRPAHVSPDMWASPGWITYGSSQLLILAATVEGAEAYIGEYEGTPGEGGDCSHIDTEDLEAITLETHRAFMLDSCYTLHRSKELPEGQSWERTVVRLNVII